MGLKDIVIGIVLFTLFVFAILNFGIQFPLENGASQTILNNTRIAEYNTAVEGNLSLTEPQFNVSQNVFTRTPQSEGQTQEFFNPLSLRSIGLGIISVPKIIFFLTIDLVQDTIFGGDSSQNKFIIILGILGSLTFVIATLYIVRWIRSGEVD